jgi:peptidylprolyl isomerase
MDNKILKTKITLFAIFVLALVILTFSGVFSTDPAIKAVNTFIDYQQIDKTKADWKTTLTQPEQATFDAESKYFWEITTSEGPLVILLKPEIAPMHVTSTIYLTNLGFYNELIFHRVISQFMAQGGDPLGNGRGNPGYKFAGEFNEQVTHDKPGLLSMANSGPNTDGSQFFLTFAPTPWLDSKHTIYGEIVEGLDSTLAAIEQLGSRSGKTSKEVTIISAKIRVE